MYSILCGLLRYSRQVQADPVNVLDGKNSHFRKFHGTCDVVFQKIQQDRIGAAKKSAQVIEVAEDDHSLAEGGTKYKDTVGLQRAMHGKSAVYVEVKNKET